MEGWVEAGRQHPVSSHAWKALISWWSFKNHRHEKNPKMFQKEKQRSNTQNKQSVTHTHRFQNLHKRGWSSAFAVLISHVHFHSRLSSHTSRRRWPPESSSQSYTLSGGRRRAAGRRTTEKVWTIQRMWRTCRSQEGGVPGSQKAQGGNYGRWQNPSL